MTAGNGRRTHRAYLQIVRQARLARRQSRCDVHGGHRNGRLANVDWYSLAWPYANVSPQATRNTDRTEVTWPWVDELREYGAELLCHGIEEREPPSDRRVRLGRLAKEEGPGNEPRGPAKHERFPLRRSPACSTSGRFRPLAPLAPRSCLPQGPVALLLRIVARAIAPKNSSAGSFAASAVPKTMV
jgi:hypothetical protein